jgi:hypothetical protein
MCIGNENQVNINHRDPVGKKDAFGVGANLKTRGVFPTNGHSPHDTVSLFTIPRAESSIGQ